MTPHQYGEKYQDHLLEQYKTYVEMAEAASQRKEQVNRYYPTLFSVLVAALLLLARSDVAARIDLPDNFFEWVTLGFGIMGIYLAIAWYLSIRSYQRLISAKYKIISNLEEALPVGVYTKEGELVSPSRQFQLADRFLPIIFILPFYALGGVVKRVYSRPSWPGVGRRPSKTPFSWHSGLLPRATA